MRLVNADTIKSGKIIEAVLGKDNFPIIKETNVCDLPIAYDVDKVVEQLEERTSFLKDRSKYNTMMIYEVADFVDDLIEIVKRGGVDTD